MVSSTQVLFRVPMSFAFQLRSNTRVLSELTRESIGARDSGEQADLISELISIIEGELKQLNSEWVDYIKKNRIVNSSTD